MNDRSPTPFSYTYSAKEQNEVRAIREKYSEKKPAEGSIEQLRRMDAAVTSKATGVSLFFGVFGTLLLGVGMCLVLTDIGVALGIFALLLGIVLGFFGISIACLAYPMYSYIVKKERERIAPEILRLADSLLEKQE